MHPTNLRPDTQGKEKECNEFAEKVEVASVPNQSAARYTKQSKGQAVSDGEQLRNTKEERKAKKKKGVSLS